MGIAIKEETIGKYKTYYILYLTLIYNTIPINRLYFKSNLNRLVMNPREMIRAHAYPVLAVSSTICLIVIASSLVPLAKWANNQNECVERTFRINGKNMQGLASKVWSCNGGGN